jgi:deuterolysin
MVLLLIFLSTTISFCSIFYNEVTTTRLCSGTTVASRNIRGGTTLHELTHATSGTDDSKSLQSLLISLLTEYIFLVGYGCSYDQGLSASQAAINADNYNVSDDMI